MTTVEKYLQSDLDSIEAVIENHLKGRSNKEIAKALDVPVAFVTKSLKQWRELAMHSNGVKDRANIALQNADEHYNMLIRAAHEALEDAEANGSVSQRLGAVRTIADLEKMRIDMLQKAGVLEGADMSLQIMETEKKQQVLIDILRGTVGACDRCRPLVHQKLSEISSKVVVINAD